LAFESIFGLNGVAGPVVLLAFGEERTNANRNLKGKAPAGDGSAWAGGAALGIDNRRRGAAGRYGG